MSPPARDAEVLVVGAGPIGLATAIEGRLAGLDVAVVEPRRGVIDKACGEGLMPGAVPALERLGVRPRGFALHGIAYVDAARRVEHSFAHGTALGVRRTTLHAALAERADELGVRRIAGRVTGLEARDAGVSVMVGAESIRAEWVIGADGLHSTVARLAGLDRTRGRGVRRYGQRRHYAVEPWSELIEVHWTPDAELYVTPTGEGTVGIAVLARRGVRYEVALEECAGLAERVRGAEAVSTLRGAGPLRRATRARARGRVLLVGDASGYVDALTGEGIRIGLAQARSAVASVVAGEPERYEREWHGITRDVRRLTGALVGLAASPLRSLVVPTAAAAPRVFAAAVERLAR